MGFHYYLRMEPDWDAQKVNVKISEVEEMISTSCLLLPMVIEAGPTKQCMYAVVHDDWSVTNGQGQTAVPKLCDELIKKSTQRGEVMPKEKKPT